MTVTADLDGGGDVKLAREVQSGSSNNASSNSRILEFGLGKATTCTVKIDWPTPEIETTLITNVPADRAIEVLMGSMTDLDWDDDYPGFYLDQLYPTPP